MNTIYRSFASMRKSSILFCVFIIYTGILTPLYSQVDEQALDALRWGRLHPFSINEKLYTSEYTDTYDTYDKLDPSLRLTLLRSNGFSKISGSKIRDYSSSPYAINCDAAGTVWVDIMLTVTEGFNIEKLSMYNARNIVRIGTIVSMIVPLDRIEELIRDNSISFIEMGARRRSYNVAGRIETGTDRVHDGIELPQPYKGEGVIVGVVDSGIDFTHPDFSTVSGTRLQFLAEYTDAGQLEWTKQQIDTNPASVTQRDLDDGGGHGTHVVGTAAGGGIYNAQYSGMAPKSDIIFVKGMIDGRFSDNTVISGCQYIFTKADVLGKPAVINLSLGSNWGPMDGSSLYEQALSNLTGPGRIIVAAAGNEGFDMIHAGGALPATTRNVTILLSSNPQNSLVNMWYKPGVISQVAVGAFVLDEEDKLVYLGNTDFVPAGTFMDYTPLVYNEYTLGYIGIDAQTTADPRNGDGNILIDIVGDPENNVNLDGIIWVILYDSNSPGQFDMWSFGGTFWYRQIGLDEVLEVPGDTFSTIGTPATSHKIIAVGSYVTSNSWTDFDGQARQWLNPDPTRQTDNPVVPSIGQKSYFSSLGPTRDGRFAPDISAPGELIFSVLSSHLNEGTGYQRALVLQGGRYLGKDGTSMASPHVTGVVALMLQADPTLTYEDILQVLQETARTDSWTGTVPNNEFGAGKIDAHAAVKQVADGTSGPGDQTILRYFDPQSPQLNWIIDRIFPIDSGFVFGTNHYFDKAKATAFTLPEEVTDGKISQVKVWFGYKRSGLTNESYSISIYDGTVSAGPTGEPIASYQYVLKDIQADDNLNTDEGPTVHLFPEAVSVGTNFFVAIDFGSYESGGISNSGIVATDFTGQRVPEVWEQWSNGQWHNLSDAWLGQQASAGSGTNGWHMWLEVVLGGTVSVPEEDNSVPVLFALEQNYPNPFNSSTTIRFSIPGRQKVRLSVYDLLGREVVTLIDTEMKAGLHSVVYDANGLASGVYLYKLSVDSFVSVKRFILIK
jgi:minor extracellular serine protease Vpr